MPVVSESDADVGCPNCGATDNWHTIETVVATSKLNFLTLLEDNTLDVEYAGDTEYHQSTVVGLQCSCGLEIDGEMQSWMDTLFPKPDLDALLALRERLVPK